MFFFRSNRIDALCAEVSASLNFVFVKKRFNDVLLMMDMPKS
jgi:hypothetical protein